MSSVMDGINSVYSINSQIKQLEALGAQNPDDPEVLQYALEQNFNKMLNDLISATNDEDDDEDNNDYFSFFTTTNDASLQSLQSQGILEKTDVETVLGDPGANTLLPDTSSTEYLNSLYDLGQL